LDVILGGRFNYASVDAGKAQDPFTGAPLSFSESWDNVVGSGRALYRIDESAHWRIFGGVSQGFRAPNLSDLTRFDIARSGELEIPTFDLEPEHFISAEGGLKVNYGRFAGEAAYYHTWIDDMIVRVPTGDLAPTGETIVSKANSGNGFIHGFELVASVEFIENWTLWGNFTWMEGSIDTPVQTGGPLQTEPVSRLMPRTTNVGLRWEHSSHKYWAGVVATFADNQDKLSSGDQRDTQRIPQGGTPGYETYGFRGGWHPCPEFTLTAAIENITDEDYRIHGSGVNEPGLNLVVAADLRF
jgi:hemoglobin/transferrin/lactoferrin receptor protein